MIVYRIWRELRRDRLGNSYEFHRDGWFLFGLVPLLTRDRDVRL